jgi:hypothetical protein
MPWDSSDPMYLIQGTFHPKFPVSAQCYPLLLQIVRQEDLLGVTPLSIMSQIKT